MQDMLGGLVCMSQVDIVGAFLPPYAVLPGAAQLIPWLEAICSGVEVTYNMLHKYVKGVRWFNFGQDLAKARAFAKERSACWFCLGRCVSLCLSAYLVASEQFTKMCGSGLPHCCSCVATAAQINIMMTISFHVLTLVRGLYSAV